MRQPLDSRGVIEFLKIKVSNFPSQEAAARAMGMSTDQLNGVLNGRQNPGPKVLRHLGLKRVWTYEFDGLPR